MILQKLFPLGRETGLDLVIYRERMSIYAILEKKVVFYCRVMMLCLSPICLLLTAFLLLLIRHHLEGLRGSKDFPPAQTGVGSDIIITPEG